MNKSFDLGKYSFQLLIGILTVAGGIITNSTPVKSQSIECVEPEQGVVDRIFEPLPANDPKRKVTVRFEMSFDPSRKFTGSGVIIGKRLADSKTSDKKYTYTVLTVDHNFVKQDWQAYNLVEPQYPPLPNLINPEANNQRVPERLTNPKVELFTCNMKRDEPGIPVTPDKVTRLRRSFHADDIQSNITDRGVDLALVEFDSDLEIYPARLGSIPPEQLAISSRIIANGWPGSEQTQNIAREGHFEGSIKDSQPPEYLGSNNNGYQLTYDDVNRKKEQNLQTQGMSGGPIFNSQGLVVGIHGGDDSKKLRVATNLNPGCIVDVEEVSDFSRAIPINTFVDQLAKVSERWTRNKPDPELNPEIFFPVPVVLKEGQVIVIEPIQQGQANTAEEKYYKGIFLLARFSGDYREALKEFKAAIDELKSDMTKKEDLAKAYYASGFTNYCRRMSLNEEQLDLKAALDDFIQAAQIENSPVALEALMGQAGVLAKMKEFEQAIKQLERAIDNNNEQIKELKEKAKNLLKESEESTNKKQEVSKLFAKATLLHTTKGMIYLEWAKVVPDNERREKFNNAEAQWKKAEEKLDEAKKSRGEEVGATNEEAMAALSIAAVLKRYKGGWGSFEAWDRALLLTEGAEDPINNFIETLLRHNDKDYKSATELLENLAKANADDDKKGIYEAAKKALMEKGPGGNNDDMLWGNGTTTGRTPEVVDNVIECKNPKECIRNTLNKLADDETYRNNPNVYMSRAYLNFSDGKLQETIDDFKQAREIYRRQPDEVNVGRVNNQLCRIPLYANSQEAQGICLPNNNRTQQQNPEPTHGQPTIQDPRKPDPSIAAGPRITETYYCDPTSGRVTVDRTQNGDRPLITWVSNRFTPWGYDPRLRCQQVSARLQEYRASGNLDLNRITYGRMNDRTVLCVARPERILQRSATRCRGGLLILTLEPRQNPEQVLREFKQVLTGTYPNPPLRKELSDPTSRE